MAPSIASMPPPHRLSAPHAPLAIGAPARRVRRLAAGCLLLVAAACAPAGGDQPAAPAADATPPGDARRGLALVEQYQCSGCHAIPGVAGPDRPGGPTLASYGGRAYLAGRLPMRPTTLARWIAEPAVLLPDTPMPDMGASDADARDMAAFLLSLR